MTDTSTGAAGHDTSAAPWGPDDQWGVARRVACPVCGVESGERCRPIEGRTALVHRERFELALDYASMPRGWAVLVRYAGPTNYRGSRWIATADHPIGRVVVSYNLSGREGLDGARSAVDELIARWRTDYAESHPEDPNGWPHRVVAGGHLPNGDYAFIVA